MAITQAQLAKQIEAAYDDVSNNSEVDPEEARKQVAKKIAAAVAQFVIGRQTQVTGTSVSGGAVTAVGTIS